MERNFRRPGFEIDIIAIKSQVLMIGEVKARTVLDEGMIPSILSPHQVKRIKKGVGRFLTESNIDYQTIRLDLFIVHGKGMNKLARYKNIELTNGY